MNEKHPSVIHGTSGKWMNLNTYNDITLEYGLHEKNIINYAISFARTHIKVPMRSMQKNTQNFALI